MNSTSFIKRGLTALVILAGVLILNPAPVLSGPNHACDFLTRAEVETIMGVAMGEVEPQPANPMGQSVCFYDIPSETAVRFAQVQMFLTGWSKKKGLTAPSMFDNNMGFLQGLKEVPGIGDKAYWGGSGMKLGAGLHVLYKEACFTVTAATGNETQNLEKAKALAFLLIEKL